MARIALSVAAVFLLLAPAAGAGMDDLAARVAQRFGARAVAAEMIALPAGQPESFSTLVPHAGAMRVLHLIRHDLRAPGFRVLVGGAGEIVPAAPATYRGVVEGEPGSVVLASLRPSGLAARVLQADGASWIIEPARALEPSAPRESHLVLDDAGSGLPLACGVADDAHAPGAQPVPGALPSTSAAPTSPTGHAGLSGPGGPSLGSGPTPGVGGTLPGVTTARPKPIAPGCVRRAQIAFDADYEYYVDRGSSVDEVVATIEGHLNEVDFLYARDALLSYSLTAILVRTAPTVYVTGNPYELLDQFVAEWNANQAAIPRDMAHLMTGKDDLQGIAGLAYVGVVCSVGIAYGWSMDSAGIIGHEVGHNWGAGHCADLSPCNNMCGACLYIAPVTRQIIMDFAAATDCLSPVAAYDDGVPPYATPEHATLHKEAWDAPAPLAFDVLANDADGNCDDPALVAFDAQSAHGAPVSASGAGLVYALPAQPFVGDDTFGYTIADASDQTATAQVTVAVRPRRLVGAWPLDDGTGAQAADATLGGHDGTAAGAPLWTTGVHGGALDFDGVDDLVSIPPPGFATDELTITTWLRRNGLQESFAGVVFSRDASALSGLNFGTNNELRYHWNGDPATYNWTSGLKPANNTWVFVALVVEPGRATLWLHDGSAWSSAVNAVPHAQEVFDGVLTLGQDPSGNRRFDGQLDEVHLYDHALTAAELDALRAQGGPAEAPRPADGQPLVHPAGQLSWLPGLLATSHDVYVGDDYFAVRDATTASPEYAGSTVVPSFVPVAVPGADTFWRVDEHVPGGVLAGRVWQFPPLVAHRWPLDEASGTTAADVLGNVAGVYLNGVLLGLPGATPATGTSVDLDGVNDRVRVPPLNLLTDRLTISAWVRRDGAQNDFAGLVFCRGGDTLAGLNVGTDEELRYHWDGGNWDWNSGLVLPDQEWVFVALVVEPTRATIWMGQGGVLTSSVHEANHGLEPFDFNLFIGRDNVGADRHFDGRVDDVRIWRASLTAQDIADVYLISQ